VNARDWRGVRRFVIGSATTAVKSFKLPSGINNSGIAVTSAGVFSIGSESRSTVVIVGRSLQHRVARNNDDSIAAGSANVSRVSRVPFRLYARIVRRLFASGNPHKTNDFAGASVSVPQETYGYNFGAISARDSISNDRSMRQRRAFAVVHVKGPIPSGSRVQFLKQRPSFWMSLSVAVCP
jgi:hypothetical protein